MITYPITDKFKNHFISLYKHKKEELREYSSPWDYESGIHCVFIPLTKRIGVKVYREKYQVCGALKNQIRAFRHGIAPEYGKMFQIKVDKPINEWDIGPTTLYCHFTEIAQTLQEEVALDENNFPTGIEHAELCAKLKEINLYWVAEDLHRFNIGRIGNRMVCIDFI